MAPALVALLRRSIGSNPGQLRMLQHVPRGLRRGAPLVVAPHGCTQTAGAYDHGSGWSNLAERHQFALLLPQQQPANNANSCFNWFSTADTRRDHGEALSVRQMIARMIRDHGIYGDRIFIVGLSAGGAMTAAMLAAYPDVFAGGAVIAGLPFGSATTVQDVLQAMAQPPERSPEAWGKLVRFASRHRGPWPKLSIWHGSDDHIVNPKNADCLVRQWTNVHGISVTPDTVTKLGQHSRKSWRDGSGTNLIAAYTIAGIGHGVPLASAQDRGHAGAFHFDVGLSSSLSILEFWGIDAVHAEVIESSVDEEPIFVATICPTITKEELAVARSTTVMRELPKPELRDNVENSQADKAAFDPRDIITTALRQADLLVPPGSQPSGGPRSIISSTLRSVGLLNE